MYPREEYAEETGVRFDFLIRFGRDLKFKCVRCGRCCSGYDGKLKLELYPSDILAINDFNVGFRSFFTKKEGLFFMKLQEDGSCPFYDNSSTSCILRAKFKFFPWNCLVYPLQAISHGDFFIVRINPAARENCPGLGKGNLLRTTLLPELIRGVVGIVLNSDPWSLSPQLAISLSNIWWL